MSFQIHHDSSERASTPEREIIDANVGDMPNWLCRQCHDTAENGEPAGLDTHAICDAHAEPPAGRQANDLDQLKESCCHTCSGSNKGGQSLGKDFLWAGGLIAEKFPHRELKAHGLPRTGQIGQFALIVTMNTCSGSATDGTRRTGLRRKQRDTQYPFLRRACGYFNARRQGKQGNDGHLGRETLHEKKNGERTLVLYFITRSFSSPKVIQIPNV